MFQYLKKRLDKAYYKEIDATGLAVFRIFYFLILLCEVLQMYYFRHLIFDPIPYLFKFEINLAPVIIIWMVVIVMLLIGAFTRVASIINFLFTLLFFGCITTFEYHMFYTFTGINGLMIFLPVSRLYSIDRIFLKLKYSNTRFQYEPRKTVSVLAYYIPLFVGLGFVYFDSIFYKFISDIWMNGLGMWLPASNPISTHINNSWLLNQEVLIKFLGYLTFAFELVFIFLFWFKKWRLPLVLIGLGLHIGILIEFPIPWFALGIIAIYALLVPIACWKKFSFTNKNKRLAFYYDSECPLCIRTRIVITSLDLSGRIDFKSVQLYGESEPALPKISYNEMLDEIYSVDRRGKVYKGINTYIEVMNSIWFLKPLSWVMRLPGIYHLASILYSYVAQNRNTERCTEENCGYTPPVLPIDSDSFKLMQNLTLGALRRNLIFMALIVLSFLQLCVTYNSLTIKKIRNETGFDKTIVGTFMSKATNSTHSVSKVFLGITSHAVFMDYHFKRYDHIIAVVYKDSSGKESFLNIVNERGMPSFMLYGSNWVKWTFRVNSSTVNQKRLSDGIQRFTAFWMAKNNKSFTATEFVVKVKKINNPFHWQKDFLQKQINKPWITAGYANWVNGKFTSVIKEIEKM